VSAAENSEHNPDDDTRSPGSAPDLGPTRVFHTGDTSEQNPPTPGATRDSIHTSETKYDVTKSVAAGHRRIQYFGDYELLEEIARGGMGVVYKAKQTKLNRLVAVKMILAGQLASELDVKRFLVEAEAAANLDHPGIVPVYEFGEYAGTHYFSMAYVDGPSLAEVAGKSPLPPREAAAIVLKLAEAVAFAHSKGVVHRDLKPENVLLEQDGQPRITDFGLAKRTDADDKLTQSGAIMGSVFYMPPEQAAGKTALIGPAADIYSLGAILYRLLTGHPPFEGGTTMEVLNQVLIQNPVPPRKRNPEIPADLETICLKCLQKQIPQRFQTAEELVQELRRFQQGLPILSRPVSQWEYVWRWCRRNPLPAGLAVGLVAVVLVGVATATTFFNRAESERKRNEQQQQTVEVLSQMVLSKTLDQTEVWLNQFFEPVERELLLMREWTYNGTVDAEKPHETNRHFIPFIKLYPQVSSLMIADDRGREHMLLCIPQKGEERQEDDWLFRRTRKDEWGDEVELSEWSGDRYDRADVYRKVIDYDPRETVWFKGGIAKGDPARQAVGDPEKIHWTEPYQFFVTKDLGITASMSLNLPQTPNVNTIVALDILLMDITRYTVDAKPTDHGKVLVLNQNGLLVGLPHDPHLLTPQAWTPYFLKPLSESELPSVRDASHAFTFSREEQTQIRSFRSGGKTWWGAAKQFQLSDELVLWMLVLLPEADFHEQIRKS
jgi:serine/threonine protein kinase